VTLLFAILDNIRSPRGGPNLLFEFDFGILITFGYIAILVFCHVHFLVNFGGSYPQNLTLIILTRSAHWLSVRQRVIYCTMWLYTDSQGAGQNYTRAQWSSDAPLLVVLRPQTELARRRRRAFSVCCSPIHLELFTG